MTGRRGRRTLLALAIVIALGGLPGLAIATRALQTGEIFSPASGHAQIIAQGVAAMPGEAAWRAVFHSIDPGGAVRLPTGGPGFILVDTGGVVVVEPSSLSLLAPTEAAFQPGPAVQVVPVGERPAGLFTIDLVPPGAAGDAAGGIPVFASDPFAAPGGARDVDLVRDLLEPGESTTVIGNEAPVLVLVTLGAIRAEATDGTTASLRVGEAGTFSGDIVLTAEGQASATFVAAVIGREAPVPAAAAATPGATPGPARAGSVQVTVYACPPLVPIDQASPGSCLRDPEAVALRLAAIDGETLRDVGPSSERDGLPTWAGLPGGDYVLQAVSFKQGFGRFAIPALAGRDGAGENGYGVGERGGYLVPTSGDAADYALEVYVFATDDAGTPQAVQTATPPPESPAAESPPANAIPTSVILIETAVPGTGTGPTATAAPRATATPRPEPIVTATPRTVSESPLVTSTAVARPRRGSIDVRVFACTGSPEAFDPANCGQAIEGFDIHLVNEEGEIVGLADATIGGDGSITWENLPFGNYLLQQPLLLPGTSTYYAPDYPLADDGSGYVLTIGAEEPVATVDVYGLPPSAAEAAATDETLLDSDLDGLVDDDEVALYGTDPANADSDFDGVLDGDEIVVGSDPLVADAAPPVEPAADSDGDRLLDGDEAAFGTDPDNADTDADGFFDGDEINLGTDPLDASSVP